MESLTLDNNITVNIEPSLGEFQVRKWKNNEIVFDSGDNKNIVTNGFYQVLYRGGRVNFGVGYSGSPAASNDLMYKCVVSTNTTEVVKQDVTMTQTVSEKTWTTILSTSGSRYPIVTKNGKQYYKLSLRYLWDLGSLNNVTITKVGISTSTNVLIAGQLIKDSNNTPVAITVLSDEQLDITYSLYVPVYTNITGTEIKTIRINGVDHNYRINILMANLYSFNANSFYFRGICTANNYGWSFLNGNGFLNSIPVLTQYDASTDFNITLSIPITATSYVPITKISNGITADLGSQFSSFPFVEYEFIDSTLTKLNNDSLVLTNKITIAW